MANILIASDHAGLDLKEKILREGANLNFDLEDLGTYDATAVDYPDYAKKLCTTFLKAPQSFGGGILICGSGQGMAIQANRFKGIRAALCWNEEVALLSRQHNNANILCMGSRLLDHSLALKIAKVFFTTKFEGGRHLRRVEKIDQ
jgi:ribose 5-phosphate isomerase B